MRFDWRVRRFDELPSTNAALKAAVGGVAPPPEGAVFVARRQTAGHGRLGRSWRTSPDKDLAFSLYLAPRVSLCDAPSLALAVGLGVAAALEREGFHPRLKWPNDILLDDRKAGGILIEALPVTSDAVSVIVGVGLNVNMDDSDAAAVDRPVRSLYMAAGRRFDVDDLLSAILGDLGVWIERWERGGVDAIRDHWLARAWRLGRTLRAVSGRETTEGVFVGLGARGEMLLRPPNASPVAIRSGDVESVGE